jgi:zinc/manganese transport system substrate-binding protein
VAVRLALVLGGPAASSGRPDVGATTTQLGAVVREVAGDGAVVHQILQANPHEYEPGPDDIRSTVGAKLVVESGDGLDHWMSDVVECAGSHPTVIAIAPDHTPHKLGSDPHWWHDPRNVETAIVVICDTLARAAPEDAATFRRNADVYHAKVRSPTRASRPA